MLLVLEDALANHLTPEVLRVPAVGPQALGFGRGIAELHVLSLEHFDLQFGDSESRDGHGTDRLVPR